MSAYAPVVTRVRRNLWGAGVLAGLFVGLVVFGVWAMGDMQQQKLQQRSMLETEQARRDQLADDLANVEQHIQRFKALQGQGLIGEGQRAQWLQALGEVATQLQLFGGFKATLDTAQELAPPEGVQPETSRTVFYDLGFELSPVVETEVMDLLNQYRYVAKGRFRLQHCVWQEPKEQGMHAKCKLRFFTLTTPTSPTAEATP